MRHAVLAGALRAFLKRPDWTVLEFSREVNIDRSAAYRILRDLEQAKVVRLSGLRRVIPGKPANIYNLLLEPLWTKIDSTSSSKRPTPNPPSSS
ncbi:MAG: helix-turn-helix domain-containing protein [Actinomycetia bacterium]|nr:helix-turn-helix domain-containing protein [Actinomycetes bacterium]